MECDTKCVCRAIHARANLFIKPLTLAFLPTGPAGLPLSRAGPVFSATNCNFFPFSATLYPHQNSNFIQPWLSC